MKTEFLILNSSEKCILRRSLRAKRSNLKRKKTGELILTIPYNANYTEKEIEQMLKDQEDWIVKTKKTIELPSSLSFPALNECWRIEYLAKGLEQAELRVLKESSILLISGGNNLDVYAKLLKKFITQKAKKFLPERVAFCYEKYNFTPRENLKIQSLKSSWGFYRKTISCEHIKTKEPNLLSLNSLILFFPLEMIDYVIVHELCHGDEMKHSKDFYSLLQGKVPDYKEKEAFFKTKIVDDFFWI